MSAPRPDPSTKPPPNPAPPPHRPDVSAEAEQAAAYFRLEGMKQAFEAIEGILAKRIEAWSQAAQGQTGRLFVPREAKARESKRKLCLIRADELERVRELLGEVMKLAGGPQPKPTEPPTGSG